MIQSLCDINIIQTSYKHHTNSIQTSYNNATISYNNIIKNGLESNIANLEQEKVD